MELLDKIPTGPGPETSVHPGVDLFISVFFLTENREAACFSGDYSNITNRFSSVIYVINQ